MMHMIQVNFATYIVSLGGIGIEDKYVITENTDSNIVLHEKSQTILSIRDSFGHLNRGHVYTLQTEREFCFYFPLFRHRDISGNAFDYSAGSGETNNLRHIIVKQSWKTE